jgi:hypothetical protein
MCGLTVCAVPFYMTIMTIHPTQRLLCAFSEPSTAWFWKEKRRNLLLVILRLAAVAIVMTSGPGFAALCKITKLSYAHQFIALYRLTRWAAAQRCWEDSLRLHAKPVFHCASWGWEPQGA